MLLLLLDHNFERCLLFKRERQGREEEEQRGGLIGFVNKVMGFGGASSSSTSSRLKRAVRKMVVAACASFSSKHSPDEDDDDGHRPSLPDISNSSAFCSRRRGDTSEPPVAAEGHEESTHNVKSKSLCAICLDPLCYGNGSSPGHAVFTAQCSHSFHFACISSNVSHGNLTCPICRAHWTQLPRNLSLQFPLLFNQNDPILRILDDSIATFRVHRRSFLRSAQYDDDDPVEPNDSSGYPRLDFTLLHAPTTHPPCLPAQANGSEKSNRVCLSVRLADQMATDLVLVASPNGPHLRLLKQSMALVVFSLRATDRLSIVSYSAAAARVFPLRRMTSYGKKTALQVIDRLFYMGHADPVEGLKKGIKIFEDRVHKNPQAFVLQLSDCPMRSYHSLSSRMPIPIHRFHVGFGFGASNGFVMHEFEEFLSRLLGGVVREVQLRVGEGERVLRLGELRCGEERQVMLELGDGEEDVYVAYSYAEGWDGYMRTGEAMLSMGDMREREGAELADVDAEAGIGGGMSGSTESWEYHDPYMARRWAKHLHGYRL